MSHKTKPEKEKKQSAQKPIRSVVEAKEKASKADAAVPKKNPKPRGKIPAPLMTPESYSLLYMDVSYVRFVVAIKFPPPTSVSESIGNRA